MLEATRVANPTLSASAPSVPAMDWERYIGLLATDILREQSPKALLGARARLYDLLVNCVPADAIVKRLLTALVGELGKGLPDAVKHEIAYWWVVVVVGVGATARWQAQPPVARCRAQARCWAGMPPLARSCASLCFLLLRRPCSHRPPLWAHRPPPQVRALRAPPQPGLQGAFPPGGDGGQAHVCAQGRGRAGASGAHRGERRRRRRVSKLRLLERRSVGGTEGSAQQAASTRGLRRPPGTVGAAAAVESLSRMARPEDAVSRG
jgi:hypothetical protein